MTIQSEGNQRAKKPTTGGCTKPCPIEKGMRLVGGKWTGSILWHLKGTPVRFNDLARMISGASKKMITERLRQLETEGLVHRRVVESSPVSVEYSLTSQGVGALDCLERLRLWAESLPDDPQDRPIPEKQSIEI